MIKTYSELIKLPTWDERFKYLKLDGQVGIETFGQNRFLNQDFYHSKEWKRLRDFVILRDNGCDLAVEGMQIYGKIYIHHMNPIVDSDIVHQSEFLINPDYLISVSFNTHNLLHYGDEELLRNEWSPRSEGDTCLWK